MTTSARVFVVDDDPHIRHLYELALADALRARGFETVLLPDATEALSLARAEPPALIVTYLRMPDVDGYELVRRLRADPATTHVPILVVSGDADEDRARRAGCDEVVFKPFSPRYLLERVLRHLSPTFGSRD